MAVEYGLRRGESGMGWWLRVVEHQEMGYGNR